MRETRSAVWFLIALVLLTSCTELRDSAADSRPTTVSTLPDVTEHTPDPDASTTTAPSPAPTTSMTASVTIEPVPVEVQERMDDISMRAGCPVTYDDLRYLTVPYRGFDGTDHIGEMVVHREVAQEVAGVFESLFAAGYPIRQIRLVDDFGAADDPRDGADDYASIEADNTSAFNCRRKVGSPGEMSQHSWGWAIDINPLENPYVSADGTTAHRASIPFLDRTSPDPPVIAEGDPVVVAFDAIGWEWGGRWDSVKDYQHFSRAG